MADTTWFVNQKTLFPTLICKGAFDLLEEKEKKYVHHLSWGSWWGYKINAIQVSVESLPLIELFESLNATPDGLASLKARALQSGVSAEEFEKFTIYYAFVLVNAGNYKSFGDSKVVPDLPEEVFEKIIAGYPVAESLFAQWKDTIYKKDECVRSLGFSPEGVTSYYGPNVTKSDAEFVAKYMTAKDLSPYNTRLFKDGDVYEIRLAGADQKILSEEEFEGRKIRVVVGDYSEYLKHVVFHLTAAQQYAGNEIEVAMLKDYVRSFQEGSIEAHKDSQRHWIKDIGPIVETNIGFIESYRDPLGVRGEWEGLVAIVDKERSRAYGELTRRAMEFIARLPWPKEFEKDEFLRPDFTALVVVAFANSGVPLGINIPNYDDIRCNEGFKNVFLANVMQGAQSGALTFVTSEDSERAMSVNMKDTEVQVGIHELLGHGCGKLFKVDEKGEKNFPEGLINPVTGQPVATWYAPGETWDSVFTSIASSLEECRAECAGLYLCVDPDILDIFGVTEEGRKDIIWANYLRFSRMGVMSLEFFNPTTQAWGQAHMQARFAIFRLLLEEGVFTMDWKDDNVTVGVIEESIPKGREAVGGFLRKLNVFKATRDLESAKALWDQYTVPPKEYIELRSLIIRKASPRPQFKQVITTIDSVTGNVTLAEPGDTSAESVLVNYAERLKLMKVQ